MASILDKFIMGLGQQNAPFGFAPPSGGSVAPSQSTMQQDPSYQAGWQTVGDIGAGMLARGNMKPMQAFGQSYLEAKGGARERSKDAMIAQQMMAEAEANRQKQEEERQKKIQFEQYISSLPPEQQAIARMNIGAFTDAKIGQQFAKPGDGYTLGEGQVRFDANGNKIASGPPKSDADFNKPPTGYRWTESGLEAIPGGPADPRVKASQGAGGVTTKMRNDAVAVDQAYNNLNTALDDYKGLIAKTGISAVPGKENDNIQQARTNLQLQLKELYNLGVLNGPDLSLMEQMIFDPQTSWTDPVGNVSKMMDAASGTFGDRASSSIDRLKGMLKTIRDNKTKGILDNNGQFTGGMSEQSQSGPPEGIAPDIWEAMTPEEQSLWQN
jgi:hypothetical protein